MKLTVGIVVTSLLIPTPLLAQTRLGATADRPIARAAEREVARLAQGEPAIGDGNPYVIPGVILIAAGTAVAVMGATMPQFRTQTDDYDLCAAANGGPTGPSTRNPACDDYRNANKGFLWVGAAAVAAGAGLLTVSAFNKSVTLRVSPGRTAVTKTTRF